MNGLVLGVVLILFVLYHIRAQDRWDAERQRLIEAATAPNPEQAHAAVKVPKSPSAEQTTKARLPIGL